MVRIGQKVNDYTIIATALHLTKDDEYVILGESDANYVTARMSPNSDKEWYWGSYHTKRRNGAQANAWADFLARVFE